MKLNLDKTQTQNSERLVVLSFRTCLIAVLGVWHTKQKGVLNLTLVGCDVESSSS